MDNNTAVTKVDKKKFYGWITEAYKRNGEMTAYECACALHHKGYIPFAHRQATHPRITELVYKGVLVEVGKKIDPNTKKHVTIYSLAGTEVKNAI